MIFIDQRGGEALPDSDQTTWMSILAFLANLGSLAGFFLTLYVYFKLRQLWKQYALIYRVPIEIEKLRKAGSRLSQLNKPSTSRQELLAVLGGMKAALESIARNIGTDYDKGFLELKLKIRKAERDKPLNTEKLDKIYADSVHLADRAFSIVEDRKHRLNP